MFNSNNAQSFSKKCRQNVTNDEINFKNCKKSFSQNFNNDS